MLLDLDLQILIPKPDKGDVPPVADLLFIGHDSENGLCNELVPSVPSLVEALPQGCWAAVPDVLQVTSVQAQRTGLGLSLVPDVRVCWTRKRILYSLDQKHGLLRFGFGLQENPSHLQKKLLTFLSIIYTRGAQTFSS